MANDTAKNFVLICYEFDVFNCLEIYLCIALKSHLSFRTEQINLNNKTKQYSKLEAINIVNYYIITNNSAYFYIQSYIIDIYLKYF